MAPDAAAQNGLASELRKKIAALPGVEQKPLHLEHATVRGAYWLEDKEFVHFHGNGQIDVRISDPALRAAILADPRAKVNAHARSRIEFDFTTPQDVEDAFRLVQRVYGLIRG